MMRSSSASSPVHRSHPSPSTAEGRQAGGAFAPTILLGDGTNLVTRAYFGYQQPPLDQIGRLALGMCRQAVETLGASHAIIAFDHPSPTFRVALAPDYKSSRKTKPGAIRTADLVAAARPVFEAAGLLTLDAPGFEADDVLATLAGRLDAALVAHGGRVLVLSSDKDLHALVSDRITVFGLSGIKGARGMEKYQAWTPAQVLERYGVAPQQLADWKALAGDDGDDIKGVRGIGAKGAEALLRTHGSLDAALEAARTTTGPGPLQRLASARGQEEALLGRQLAQLRADVPLPDMRLAQCRIGGGLRRVAQPAVGVSVRDESTGGQVSVTPEPAPSTPLDLFGPGEASPRRTATAGAAHTR